MYENEAREVKTISRQSFLTKYIDNKTSSNIQKTFLKLLNYILFTSTIISNICMEETSS